MLNYQKGDVGEYAYSLTKDNSDYAKFNQWQTEFMSMLNGGNRFESNQGVAAIATQLSSIYKNGGGSPGPYRFALNGAGNLQKLAGSNYLCDNGQNMVRFKKDVYGLLTWKMLLFVLISTDQETLTDTI